MGDLVWVFVAIVAIDVIVVAWFVLVELVERFRIDREIRELDAIWRAPPASLGRRRASVSPARGVPARVTTGTAEERRAAPTVSAYPMGAAAVRRGDRVPGAVRRALVAVAVLAIVAVLGPPVRQAIAPDEGVGGPSAERASGSDARSERDGGGALTDGLAPSEGPLSGDPGEAPGTTASTAVSHRRTVPETVAAEPRSSTAIRLVWTEVPEATGYLVLRRDDSSSSGPSSWVEIGRTSEDTTAFTDVRLESDTTYFYRVAALTEEGSAPPSDVVSATTQVAPPSAPEASASADDTAVTISWTDVAGETGYGVERSLDGTGDWVTIGTTGQDVTTYTDGGLTPGTTYHYRVIATNEGGGSPPSNVVSVTVPKEQDDQEQDGSTPSPDGALSEESPSPSPSDEPVSTVPA